jgi:aryl-alcohol dehydrogenase-like predicted oxidoreductase
MTIGGGTVFEQSRECPIVGASRMTPNSSAATRRGDGFVGSWQKIEASMNASLPVRPLGSTGLVVSSLGLGLAALGRPAYITLGRGEDLGDDRSVARFERHAHEMLDAAIAAGVRYVDAARSYGLAEDFLGSWLRTRRPPDGSLTIGSKWGYTYVGGWRLDAPVHEVKDLSAETLRRQIAESRTRLGARLQLYQIHSATLESGVLDDSDVLGGLAHLRSTGLAIGVTVSGPRQAEVIRRALHVTVDGVNPFHVVQATWNLLEPSAGPALAEAKAAGWGVIVKEGLANGRLTPRNRDERIAPLKTLAASRRTTVDALALAAALAQPWADIVLSGAVTLPQLHSNLDAARVATAPIEWPQMAEPAAEYWTERSALAWT